MDFTRRNFLKGAIAGSAALTIGSLTACGNKSQTPAVNTATYPSAFAPDDFESSRVVLEKIEHFKEEKTYDIVVIGAGTAGVPAVLTALEEGASVACLQKEATSISQGNNSSGFILELSTENAIPLWMQSYREAVSYRTNWGLLDFFARYSGETLCWLDKKAAEVNNPAFSYTDTTRVYGDEVAAFRRHTFGNKPQNNHDLILSLSQLAAEMGAEFFYKTPGVQLIIEDGACVGVVGEQNGEYIRFNATKAVIVATGDYQNNQAMVAKFSPDVAPFTRKQTNKTGDGILMCVAAGGNITPVGHAKQMHDMDSAPKGVTDIPFLALDMNGKRFMNEVIPMISWNLSLREANATADDPGLFCRIFDSQYQEKVSSWGGKTPAPEALENYIPGFKESPKGVYPDLVHTHRCDTLEELAEELGLPADALIQSVERYNELCAAGSDSDFGVNSKYLKSIDTPPFWGIRQWVRVSAICSGVKVNQNYQVTDQNMAPIPGLYAAGFCAGDVCGDHEWIYLDGMACGSCFTSGRYATIHAVTGDYTPSHPVSWSEVEHLYAQCPPSDGKGANH